MKETIESIIKQVLKNDIGVTLEYNENTDTVSYVISGFYKSQCYLIQHKDGEIIAHQRYLVTDKIESFRDLVAVNYKWWQKSKDQYPQPNHEWIKVLLDYEYITETTSLQTSYEGSK